MSAPQSAHAVHAQERQQILNGLLLALENHDPTALTEADVLEAALLPQRVFREHFASLEECFDFSCEASLDVLLTPMAAAFSAPRPRRERLSAALAALLGALSAQPRFAELCLLHSQARQTDQRTYRRAVDSLADLLRRSRRPSTADPPPPDTGERALARGTIGAIAAHLADGHANSLQSLHPHLLEILLPPLDLDRTEWPNAAPSVG